MLLIHDQSGMNGPELQALNVTLGGTDLSSRLYHYRCLPVYRPSFSCCSTIVTVKGTAGSSEPSSTFITTSLLFRHLLTSSLLVFDSAC